MWIEEISVRAEIGPWLLSSGGMNQLQGQKPDCRRWGFGRGRSSLAADARVDDDKFLARESENRQCWAGEAWATLLMSAIGWEQWAFYYYDVTLAL